MIEAGTIITCPNPKCGRWIAKARIDLREGEQIQAAHFESIGNVIANGEAMVCSRCGWQYCWEGRLHTKEGWKP